MTAVNPEPSPAASATDAALRASRNLAIEAAQLAADRHLQDVTVLELAGRSPVAKHFLIGTGTSSQQIRSVGQELADLGRQQGFAVFGKSGLQEGRWVVIDFVDLVVHLFDPEFRRYYDLELLWGDCPTIDWRRPDQRPAPAAEPST